MTSADDVVVRRQIVVDAPIEQGVRGVRRAVRRLQAAGAQPPRRRRSRGRRSSRTSAGTSTTSPRTAASAGGPGSSPTSRRTGWCSAGTSARTGSSRPTRPTPARSRSGSSPRPRTAPGSSSSTATSTATAPAGRACATASTATRLAAVPGPVRRPARRGLLTWHAIIDAASRSTGRQRRCSPTPPTRRGSPEWQKGVVDGVDGEAGHAAGRRPVPDHPPDRTREPAGHLRGRPRGPALDLGGARYRRTDPGDRRCRRWSRSATSQVAPDDLRRVRGPRDRQAPRPARSCDREARKEMPENLAALKQRLEAA